MNKKYHLIAWIFWIFIFVVNALIVINNIPTTLRGNTPTFYLNFIQRAIGLTAIVVLALQIFMGAYIEKIAKKFGTWVYGFHLRQGIFIYTLILVHIFSLFISLIISTKKIDPFYIFTDFCILCNTRPEFFISFGRFAFWTITFAVLVAVFRKSVQLKTTWKYYHILSYIAFILISFHTYFLGRDVHKTIFFYIFVASVFFVIIAGSHRVLQFLKKYFRLK